MPVHGGYQHMESFQLAQHVTVQFDKTFFFA